MTIVWCDNKECQSNIDGKCNFKEIHIDGCGKSQ
jgi:hypothetical protein